MWTPNFSCSLMGVVTVTRMIPMRVMGPRKVVVAMAEAYGQEGFQ